MRKQEAINWMNEKFHDVSDEHVILFARLIEDVHNINFMQSQRYHAQTRETAIELLAGFFNAGRMALAQVRPIIEHIIQEMEEGGDVPNIVPASQGHA